MEMDFNLSPDTQVILLLCGNLGRTATELKPLTRGQYDVCVSALMSLDKRPADLMEDTGPNEAIIREVCAIPNTNARVKETATSDQIVALLRRGMTLSTAIGKWSSYGVRVASKADAVYPKRLRDHLGRAAPTFVYYAGNPDLFAGGGMAFVGARDLGGEAEEAIREVVKGCVDLGMPVVSGGAKGADQTAMQTAAALGGTVVGVLPCNLLQACLNPSNREALANGQALLFSAFDPEVRPFKYSPVAMARNKFIYGMADSCFVAQSGIGSKSGTWSGAAEELKRGNQRPVYVFLGNPPSEGCLDLVKRGAKVWDMNRSVSDNLSASHEKSSNPTLTQGDLFSDCAVQKSDETQKSEDQGKTSAISVASPMVASEISEAHSTAGVGSTPYDLFLVFVKRLLSHSCKESDVKKQVCKEFDLVPSQFNRWLTKSLQNGVLVRREVLRRTRKLVMLEVSM